MYENYYIRLFLRKFYKISQYSRSVRKERKITRYLYIYIYEYALNNFVLGVPTL